jgi:tRNA pseudouridine55 synthase
VHPQAEIEAVLRSFLGPQQQVPPMYSALKQAGEPLYRLARAGRTVERSPRRIELFSLALAGAPGATSLELEALCSKGTYVRVLAEDIARALGSCGHVTALRRLYVEPFAEAAMLGLDELSVRAAACTLPPLLPPDFGLGHLPAVHLTGASSQRVLHGERVAADLPGGAVRVRLYDESGEFLGLGEADGSGGVQPRRLLRLGAQA